MKCMWVLHFSQKWDNLLQCQRHARQGMRHSVQMLYYQLDNISLRQQQLAVRDNGHGQIMSFGYTEINGEINFSCMLLSFQFQRRWSISWKSCFFWTSNIQKNRVNTCSSVSVSFLFVWFIQWLRKLKLETLFLHYSWTLCLSKLMIRDTQRKQIPGFRGFYVMFQRTNIPDFTRITAFLFWVKKHLGPPALDSLHLRGNSLRPASLSDSCENHTMQSECVCIQHWEVIQYHCSIILFTFSDRPSVALLVDIRPTAVHEKSLRQHETDLNCFRSSLCNSVDSLWLTFFLCDQHRFC